MRLLALIVNYVKIASAFGFYVGFGLCKNVGIDWLEQHHVMKVVLRKNVYTAVGKHPY